MSKRQGAGDKSLKAVVGMFPVLQERQSGSTEPNGERQLKVCVVGCRGDQTPQDGQGRVESFIQD